ncbi:hypothetical protein LCGC14_1250960 [marine sediment metagenome]|uniref:Uncharacterized protein n=1 Tax=marine sediment metagenome TaxID=412755 RepID=A0A0F9L6S7_9ZZZZ
MSVIARDSNGVARWLRVDANGKLILGDAAALIGHVKITDGTETANVNASNQLEVSVENAVAVTGDFYPVTQPVSGTFWQVTQPVSATNLDIRNLAPATDTVKIGDGTETASINTSNQLETANTPQAYSGRTFKYEDTSFVTGESPITLDVNTDLGRNSRDGYIICDGGGNLLIEFSDNGTNYGSQHTLKSGEVISLTGLDIDKIKITWVTDSAYRILVI